MSLKIGENEVRFYRELTEEVIQQIDIGAPPVAEKLAEVVQEAGERAGVPVPQPVSWAIESWEYTVALFRSLDRLVLPGSDMKTSGSWETLRFSLKVVRRY
jgi:hypothetical protein